MMVLAFLINWTPLAVIYFAKLNGIRDVKSSTIIDILPLLCVKLGCTFMNVILYGYEKKRVGLINDICQNYYC